MKTQPVTNEDVLYAAFLTSLKRARWVPSPSLKLIIQDSFGPFCAINKGVFPDRSLLC